MMTKCTIAYKDEKKMWCVLGLHATTTGHVKNARKEAWQGNVNKKEKFNSVTCRSGSIMGESYVANCVEGG